MVSVHTIKCKLNGRPLCMFLNGGWCVCPSTEKCAMKDEWDKEALEKERTNHAEGSR